MQHRESNNLIYPKPTNACGQVAKSRLGLMSALILIAFIVLAIWIQRVNPLVLTDDGRAQLESVFTSSRLKPWDLIGTIAYAVYGFLTAKRLQYGLWGAFILTLLPAVGGGVVRDLLIGGERLPLFIFNDPSYLIAILAVLFVGVSVRPKWPSKLLIVADSIGLATFAVIGTRVALLAELPWYWWPISAALTCTGGGILMDVITAHEPKVFTGEPYEEIAYGGGFLLTILWFLQNQFFGRDALILMPILVAWLSMFSLRLLVVRKGWRSWRLTNDS